MKKTILLVLLSITITNAQNEPCQCAEDFSFLDDKVRKTPAYKVNKDSYEAGYTSLVEEARNTTTSYDCHVLLNTLLLGLNDNHSKVYSIDPGATEEVRTNNDAYATFKNSKLFNAFPRPNINLDSLRTALQSTPIEAVEGVYKKEGYVTLGVYKHNSDTKYTAVVLNSETELWEPGTVMYTLIPFGNEYLLSVGGDLASKRLIAYTERIEQGVFYFMGFRKDAINANFASEVPYTNTYHREELSENITYLMIGSFNAWYPTLSDAETFYASLDGTLTKEHLIVDLRNNGGGGDRNSDILYKILKGYAKQNKIYVLTNHRTISNAEQFAYKLSKFDATTLVGQRTNGTAAYELKGDNYTLPCGHFVAVLTSKKHSAYLPIESQGVKPEIVLAPDRDWITQLTTFIENNSK
ncbi:S41 family peptidase [Altibacter sp.]|uniref:S41 family peptidase n=1 Tax=Altibacter sp. TaxID=2024823 RepID=UPI000C9079DE|nr:S41 family peptidase [Altibacter sp.]MAP54951.1 hypothetical protein [Altibacter sp.]